MNIQINSFQAWGASLPRAIGWPVAVWLMPLAVLSALDPNWLLGGIWFGLCATAIHLMSYTLLALPIYLVFWAKFPKLWTWGVGLPLGVILGMIAMLIMLKLMFGQFFPLDELDLVGVFVGVGYGVVSSSAAITSAGRIRSQRLHEQKKESIN